MREIILQTPVYMNFFLHSKKGIKRLIDKLMDREQESVRMCFGVLEPIWLSAINLERKQSVQVLWPRLWLPNDK